MLNLFEKKLVKLSNCIHFISQSVHCLHFICLSFKMLVYLKVYWNPILCYVALNVSIFLFQSIKDFCYSRDTKYLIFRLILPLPATGCHQNWWLTIWYQHIGHDNFSFVFFFFILSIIQFYLDKIIMWY